MQTSYLIDDEIKTNSTNYQERLSLGVVVGFTLVTLVTVTTSMPRLSFKYRGLIVPVFTPFSRNGLLNLDIIPRYAEFLAEKGINGVLVCGTSGEGMSMSVNERKLVADAWSKATTNMNLHLMVQIGGAPLPDVIELAKHAEGLRVDSILCLPELYFKPTTPEQLMKYLEKVGKAAPNTPMLYYHIPMFTCVNIDMGEFLNSIGEKIPTFVGIKFTSTNLVEGAAAMRADNQNYVVFLGNDHLIYAASALGMDSFIVTSANIYPKIISDLIAACKNGDNSKARNLQETNSRCISALGRGDWVEIMKKAMNEQSEIYVGPPRASI